MTVTSDLSPVEPAVQRSHKRMVLKQSAKNVSGFADWERCAKEFSCDKTLFSLSVPGKHFGPWRKTVVCQGANGQCQPKAKKRLASSLADEVLPSKVSGKCCV